MELELMKRSNLYKEMKEGIDIETEKEIASNFFNFFRQVCVDEEKDFDETISLVSNIVILLEVDKFLENFWTIKIIDFYCFDTNDTLVRMVNLVKEFDLEDLDFGYNELALFQKIFYYVSPKLKELNNDLQHICFKHIVEVGSIDDTYSANYHVIVHNKPIIIGFSEKEREEDAKFYYILCNSVCYGSIFIDNCFLFLYDDYLNKDLYLINDIIKIFEYINREDFIENSHIFKIILLPKSVNLNGISL